MAVVAEFEAIVPSDGLPPPIPFTLQVTCDEARPAPDTETVKICAPPVKTLAVDGARASAIVF